MTLLFGGRRGHAHGKTPAEPLAVWGSGAVDHAAGSGRQARAGLANGPIARGHGKAIAVSSHTAVERGP